MSKKDEYVQKLHEKLDEWNIEIDKLKSRLRSAKAESQGEYQQQIENLQEKRNSIETKMKELHDAGETAWADLKTGIESAWRSMENAIKTARSRFK